MRLQYVAVVAATALAASTDGLQIAPNSAKSTSLRASADVRYPPYVEGKGERFLISEAKNDVFTKPPTGYEFSALQEEGDVSQLQEDDDEYEDYSEGSDSSASDGNERLGRRKKKKKKKKSKATETPTPTPTPTPTGTETPQPSTPMPTGTGTPQPSATTPAPTTQPPSAVKHFVSWLKRVLGD